MSSEIESGIRSTNHNQLCCSNLNSTIAAIGTEIVEKVSRTTRSNKRKSLHKLVIIPRSCAFKEGALIKSYGDLTI